MGRNQSDGRAAANRRQRKRRRRLAVVAVLLLVSMGGLTFRYRAQTVQEVVEEQTQEAEQEETAGWNTGSYRRKRERKVLTLEDGETAMDWRLAALPESSEVDLDYFNDAVFLGDSLTQGMELYDKEMQDASFCAYKGIGPNAVVNNMTCTRSDGTKEIPLDALTAYQPKKVYILLGTNVLTQDRDFSNFIAYYGVMIDNIRERLPHAIIYVQSITPLRPEVSADPTHAGMYKERFCRVNDALAALAVEKDCYFLNLWDVLADENGDLIAEYAQPDGYHLKINGYNAWVGYLRTHTVSYCLGQQTAETETADSADCTAESTGVAQ